MLYYGISDLISLGETDLNITLSILCILLYGAACATHLVCCTPPEQHRIRKISKGFLMPLLALCYLLVANPASPLVVIAVLCGFAGDVLLIRRDSKLFFTLGLSAFAVGHVCYSIHMLRLLPRIPAWWVLAIACVCYFVAGCLLYRKLLPYIPRELTFPCLAYIVLICAMSLTAFMVMLGYGGLNGIMLFAGSLFFLLSDSILSLSEFGVHTFRYRDLLIMSTYILAQTLIISGLIGL